MAQVTHADLIRHCKDFQDQYGIMALLDILADITECQAQAAGISIVDEEFDEIEVAYFTVQ